MPKHAHGEHSLKRNAIRHLMKQSGYCDIWQVPDGDLRDALLIFMFAGMRGMMAERIFHDLTGVGL